MILVQIDHQIIVIGNLKIASLSPDVTILLLLIESFNHLIEFILTDKNAVCVVCVSVSYVLILNLMFRFKYLNIQHSKSEEKH